MLENHNFTKSYLQIRAPTELWVTISHKPVIVMDHVEYVDTQLEVGIFNNVLVSLKFEVKVSFIFLQWDFP